MDQTVSLDDRIQNGWIKSSGKPVPKLSLLREQAAGRLPRFDKPQAYAYYRNEPEEFFEYHSQHGVDVKADREIVLGLLDDLSEIRTEKELYNTIAYYEGVWRDHHFVKGGLAGWISGNTSSIARHSTEFWTLYPDAIRA